MKPPAATAVVIPTCNRPQLLRQCLDTLAVSIARVENANLEVIVTDDSGDDATRTLIAEHFPWVQWVRGPRKGPASNRNNGMRAAHGQWLLFTDDDCLVAPEWVGSFLEAIARGGGYQVFEGKTVADRERSRIDEESPVNLTGGYLWSCNMAISKELLERLGGFCESFPHAAMEDVDLRLRVVAVGEGIAFVPAAVVCHPYRPVKGLPFVMKRGASYLYLLERHPDLLGATPWRTFLVKTARSVWVLVREAVQYRFKGAGFAVLSLVIGVYYDVLARLRVARSP